MVLLQGGRAARGWGVAARGPSGGLPTDPNRYLHGLPIVVPTPLSCANSGNVEVDR